ncbi:unnamed protein product [Gemmataceae bacterium]|nr:unnamed protein product [Gemmataceae bacterium]VTT99152.1 unnamed protein product [Gemmataceae bacterium]
MTALATTFDRRTDLVPVTATGTEGFTAAEIEEVKVLLLVRYLAAQTWDSDCVLDRVRSARDRRADSRAERN